MSHRKLKPHCVILLWKPSIFCRTLYLSLVLDPWCIMSSTVYLALFQAPVWLLTSALDPRERLQIHMTFVIWLLCQKHVTRLVKYPSNLCTLEHFCFKTAPVTLHAVTYSFGLLSARLHTSTAIKRLRNLLLWAFDHNLIPQLLLTSQLGLGIQELLAAFSPSHNVVIFYMKLRYEEGLECCSS
jgi:hypothetical protein